MVDVVSKINTGAKYDSKAFQKSVGLNGVGTKAVNALSSTFMVQRFREGQHKMAEFAQGVLVQGAQGNRNQRNATARSITFLPDETIFKQLPLYPGVSREPDLELLFLNAGLTINFNGQKYVSKNGLLDLLKRKTNAEELRYPIIHLKGEDIEVAMTHGNHYGEEYYSFVNGQHTTQGGTHQARFREAMVKTIRDFYKKDYDASDVRAAIVRPFPCKVQEPVFESQTKTKLGSHNMCRRTGQRVRGFIADFL